MYRGKYLQGVLSDDAAEKLVNLMTVDEVKSLEGIIYDIDKKEIEEMKKEVSKRRKEGSLLDFENTYNDTEKRGKLRPMQTKGVAFMYYGESVLLGDEVGLGKTVQVAGLCNLLKQLSEKKGKGFRYCFLTEKASVGQIRDKMIQFTGDYVEEIESGQQKNVETYISEKDKGFEPSIVGSHSLLNSSEFLIHTAQNPFDLIVVDEGSVLKNTSSDIYKNAKALFKYHKRKLILNATPLEQSAEEFYNQLDLLDDTYLVTREEFRSTFCRMEKGMLGFEVVGYKNTEIFREMIKLRYIARTRKGEGAVYEGNHFQQINVPLSKEQKKLMRKTTLHQMVGDYPPGVQRDIPYTKETTPKLGYLLNIIKGVDLEKGKVLVYCRFIACQEGMKKELEGLGYRVAIINGQGKAKEKKEILGRFSEGFYDILITNVQRGLDLDICSVAIMYTIDPNPQKMVQLEGRITRDFDVKYKQVYFLVSEGKERKFLEQKIKPRVDAALKMVNVGESLTLEALRSKTERGRSGNSE